MTDDNGWRTDDDGCTTSLWNGRALRDCPAPPWGLTLDYRWAAAALPLGCP